jgi:hypothetical protein
VKIRYDSSKQILRPEDFWGVDDDFADSYREHIEYGRAEALRQKLAIVSICRNAMPRLPSTLRLVDELAGKFRDAAFYVYENDSVDGTAEALDDFAIRQWVTVEHETLGEPDTRGFEPDRTVRLAKCRTKCQDWVRSNAQDAGYVVVLDADPHGGFSVDGVLNSIGWFCEMMADSRGSNQPGAMASYSLYMKQTEEEVYGLGQYDAWAARLNWWSDLRQHEWFHLLLPPVGSPPIPMNSAFGGLCVYRKNAFLSLRYEGGDCEHVPAHRAMKRSGYQLYLNPGSRYVAILP